jgi:branched-chain amino acid transport system substrate-binding protein
VKRAVGVGLISASLLVTAACSSSGGGSGGSSNAPTAGTTTTGTSTTGTSTSASPSSATPTGAPIEIGVMVQQTGPNSQSNAPAAPGAKAWAGWVNAHGGINGHPVKLEIVDSQATPAKAISELADLVSKHVVAIGSFLDSGVENAIAPDLDKAKIPLLGSSPSTAIWTTDPNFFPTGTNVSPDALNAVPASAKKLGIDTFGAVVCAEATVCKQIDQLYKPLAKSLGLKYAGAATAAASQPDFTAVCLQLQKEKAGFVDLELGSATSDTLVTNCATQGYNPIYQFTYSAFANSLLKHSGITAASVQPVLPWFAPGNQEATDFRAAYKQYSGDSKDPEVAAMYSWTSLQTLKAAIEAGGSDTPTAASVYKGLYALKDFTANGLLPAAVQYTKGKPATPMKCYFLAGIKGGKLDLPSGAAPICPS